MALTVTDILKFRESENDPWQRLLLQANINFNLIYPVGSIYMSTVNVDPATLFGGTWEQLEDRFLLGAGSTYTAGDSGGSDTHAHTTGNHTLTVNEIPSHTHNIYGGSGDVPDWFGGSGNAYGIQARSGTAYNYLGYTGSGQAHNHGNTGSSSNMPPYIVVYMWKRLTLSPSLTPLPMNVLGDVASQDIVPVSMGGTGADNAADARTNLGVQAISREIYTGTTDAWGQFVLPTSIVDPNSDLVLSMQTNNYYLWWRTQSSGVVVQVFNVSNNPLPVANTSVTVYIFISR